MHLAKFFHRPPGDDDRELLLIPGADPMVIGIYMGESRPPDDDEFLREQFSGIAEAVSAFRRHAGEWRFCVCVHSLNADAPTSAARKAEKKNSENKHPPRS